MEDRRDNSRDDVPVRDRLNYLREELARLRDRIKEEADRERRDATLPFEGPTAVGFREE